jgi:hypothetical protein
MRLSGCMPRTGWERHGIRTRCSRYCSHCPSSAAPSPSPIHWLFEVKYDGFRALAYCDPSGVRLISRNGERFASSCLFVRNSVILFLCANSYPHAMCAAENLRRKSSISAECEKLSIPFLYSYGSFMPPSCND